jgi:hypothetical protein
MTHQAIRISLAVWGRVLKAFNEGIFTAALCVAFYGLVANFSDVRAGVGKLFGKVTQIQSFEGFNVKAAFKVDQIAETTPIYASLPTELKELLPADILSLKPAWVERLLYVGDQGKLCDFENADQKMTENYGVDRHLAVDGLIALRESREVKALVLEDMRRARAKGEDWSIGEPRFCYVTELTERGRNVKTALVQFLRAGFAVASTGAAEARVAAGKVKVAGVAQR